MLKPALLSLLLALAGTAQTQGQTAPPAMPGPFPEPGVFCGPFKLCTPDVVTRGAG